MAYHKFSTASKYKRVVTGNNCPLDRQLRGIKASRHEFRVTHAREVAANEAARKASIARKVQHHRAEAQASQWEDVPMAPMDDYDMGPGDHSFDFVDERLKWLNAPSSGSVRKGAEVSIEAASTSQNPPTALPTSSTPASGASAAPSVEEGRPTVIPQVGEKRRRDDVDIAEIGVDNGGEKDVGGDTVGNTHKTSKHSPIPPDLDRTPQPSSSPSLTNDTPPVSEHEQKHRKKSERGADVDPLHPLSEPVQAVKAL
ncbi:hypothetical protein L198_00079 [Cryptococcus wingfieldii CBS 7118]|uniref:Uncharacterized protein n=1 Tax=Cryptococcus wingfieldii CBS 7118 TaxID=1295528 RepID=A0A1E3K577_9TREE|nr:hypothetical protein L198_00079 [Cryptococcus wingfieldii CBS 7118]ODO08354.1 hypothetical protein L198_00079 [Cryptococcus wingfieldii CBS 7118]